MNKNTIQKLTITVNASFKKFQYFNTTSNKTYLQWFF